MRSKYVHGGGGGPDGPRGARHHLAKLVISAFSLEFISLSPLFTSVVAGGVFVLGLIVAGTLADY